MHPIFLADMGHHLDASNIVTQQKIAIPTELQI